MKAKRVSLVFWLAIAVVFYLFGGSSQGLDGCLWLGIGLAAMVGFYYLDKGLSTLLKPTHKRTARAGKK